MVCTLIKFASPYLSIYYQNVRGLRTKTRDFLLNLSVSSYDVIILTETWLKSNIHNSELFDRRYLVYRKDRVTSRSDGKKDGGGVLIAVSRKFHSKRLIIRESCGEDLWISIQLSHTMPKKMLELCAVYIPPPVTKLALENFLNKYTNFDNSEAYTCIVGDFNMSFLNWKTLSQSKIQQIPVIGQILIDFLSINNLRQCNHIPNSKDKILDLVLVNTPNCDVDKSCMPLSTVDPLHPPVDINLDFNLPSTLKYNSSSKIKKYFKADYVSIANFLKVINWEDLFNKCVHVDSYVDCFYKILNEAIDRYVPLFTSKNNRYPPWFNYKLIRMLKEKNKIRKKYKKYGNPLDKISLNILSKRCSKYAKECYKLYFSKVEDSIRVSPKFFWSFLKNKRGGNSMLPEVMTDGDTCTSNGTRICELFCHCFSKAYLTDSDAWNKNNFNKTSITNFPFSSISFSEISFSKTEILKLMETLDIYKGSGPDNIPPVFIVKCANNLVIPLHFIYNKSLETGIFPTIWKLSKVVPVYKEGAKDVVGNYRPISILSIFAKLFEALLNPILQGYLSKFLTNHQFGFRKYRSTCSNLVTYVESVSAAVDNGKEVHAIYTDFSKAFDRVDHKILLQKLSLYGITGPLLKWIASYLSKRKFYVVVNNYQSTHCEVLSGVPQGSHLGPTFFNFYINDVINCFHFSDPYLFADDLKISKIVSSIDDVINLQADLHRLADWCKHNNITLNSNKCKYIKFSRKSNTISSSYKINNIVLPEVDSVDDLGVILDSKLTFVPHIDSITKRALRTLGFILRNSKDFRNIQTKKLLYNSLVRSKLEYCSIVWRPHFSVHSLRIERIQKRFINHLCYCIKANTRRTPYMQKLKKIDMISLEKRRDWLDINFFRKLLKNEIDCPQLLSSFNFRIPRKIPRNPITLLAPPLRRTVFGANSPIPRISRLVNSFCDYFDIFADSNNKIKKCVLLNC